MENTNSGGGSGKVIGLGIIALIVVAGVGYFAMNSKSIAPVKGVVKNTPVESVATVNGVAIPKSTFDTQLAAAISTLSAQGTDTTSTSSVQAIKAQVLNDLISNEIVNQEVTKAGIKAAPEAVESQYQSILSQIGGADKLKAQLTSANMTDAQLRENIAKQLAVQTFLLNNIATSTIKVTDADISAFYKAYSAGKKDVPALKTLSAQIKQQLILNKQQELAAAFVASLRAKASIQLSPSI